MKDTCLKDFSEDQLRTMLRLSMKEMHELRAHVKSLTAYNSIAHLMREKIREYQSQIEELDVLVTQFSLALSSMQAERIIKSN